MVSKLFSSLILFVVLCNLLLVSCDNADTKENDPKTNAAKDNDAKDKDPNENADQNQPNLGKETTPPTVKQKDTTASPKPTEAKPAGTTAKAKEDDKDPDVLSKVSEDCKTTVGQCFSAASKIVELKNKKLADVSCDAIGKGKDCFTTGAGGKKCSDDDFDKLKQYVCFCPRTAASVVLVAILCILSTFLGRE